jgi:GntR family transcriptional regulator
MKAVIDKTSSVPLYVQIQQVLQDRIASGQYTPGDQIPSEQDLSLLFDVSRMTVRKALEGLVARGILFRQKGKGTFIAEDLVSYGFSTMMSFSRTLRARGYDVKTKVLRKEIIPGSPGILNKLELPPDSEVIIVRRLRYVEGQAVALHTSFVDARTYAPLMQVDLSEASLLQAIESISGKPIAYTKDSVRAALVNPADRKLLELDAGSPVLEVEGIAFTEHGQPNRYTHAVYRSDTFRLVVTNVGKQSASFKLADDVDT